MTLYPLDTTDYENCTLDAYMGMLLAHEVAHIIGLDEVNEGKYLDCPRQEEHESYQETICIMGKFATDAHLFYNQILSGEESGFCDFCMNMMLSLLPNDFLPEDYSPEPERSNRNEEDNRFANIADSVYTSVCVQ